MTGRTQTMLAIVVAGFTIVFEFLLYAHLTMSSADRAPWDSQLPAHIVRTKHVWPLAAGATFLALGALQSWLLFFASKTAWPNAKSAVFVVACCVAAVASVTALRAPYMTSNDAYAYVAYSKLDGPLYALPAGHLAQPFDVIENIWAPPLLPAYGALDLFVYRVTAGTQSTLAGALLAVRLVGLATVLLLALLAYALTKRLELAAIILINPGLYQQMVVNGHNDLIAVDLVLAGVLLARRSAIAGTIVAALSGMIKVNFTVIAPAFAPENASFAKRLIAIVTSILLVVAGSAIFGGLSYWQALTHVAHAYGDYHRTLQSTASAVFHVALAAFAILALALAAFGGRTPRTLAWSFSGLAVAIYANYLVWGVPYALKDARGARVFFALLPLPSLTCDFIFPGSGDLTYLAIVAFMAYELLGLIRTHGTTWWRPVPAA